MTDKTHQLIGLTAASAVFVTYHPQPVTWSIVATIFLGSFIGSVAPDIDQPTAQLWQTIPLGGHLLGTITSRLLGGHRNLSHSILGVALFSALLAWIGSLLPHNWWLQGWLLSESAIIGFIAHLLADSITVEGIPLFWPFGSYIGFPPHPFQGLRIVTGKWFENLIIFPAVILLLASLIMAHWSLFQGLIH